MKKIVFKKEKNQTEKAISHQEIYCQMKKNPIIIQQKQTNN